MELAYLGAALQFGINLETQAGQLYQYLSQSAQDEEQKRIIDQLLKSNEKRKRKLERVYTDNIYSDQDTGIFEPISSIEGDDYLVNISIEEDYIGLLVHIVELEEKCERFYYRLVEVLQHRRQSLSRDFEQMAQENHDRFLVIKSIYKC
jgi:rubrerythrin